MNKLSLGIFGIYFLLIIVAEAVQVTHEVTVTWLSVLSMAAVMGVSFWLGFNTPKSALDEKLRVVKAIKKLIPSKAGTVIMPDGVDITETSRESLVKMGYKQALSDLVDELDDK